MNKTWTAAALTVFAAACFTNPEDINASLKCSTNADCTVPGTTCDTSTGIGVCVATCGDMLCSAGQTCVNNACVDTTCVPACASYQTCNTQANPPACVAVDCSTDCTLTNEVCDLTTFMCVAPTTGTIAIQSPDGGVFGVQTALPVVAKATAPGGPTQVALIVEQGTHAPFIDVATGSNGVYTGAVALLDAGFTTGTATVTGTVFWVTDGGVEVDAGPTAMNTRTISIDVDPPVFGTPATDKAFYSGVATPAQTALVTVPITDLGPAGVNALSVTLTVTGHTAIPATTIPDGGAGSYVFDVPATLFPTGAGAVSVAYSLSATDKVGNTATDDAGSLALDNVPPVLDMVVSSSSGGWIGGDGGVTLSVNATDPAGGSGLDAGSVAVLLSGGATVGSPTANANTYTFATTGSALQGAGQQGPVPFGFIAADNARNVTIIDGGSLLVDELAPVVGASTAANGTATADGGWYAINSGTIAVTTLINDGTGSGEDGGLSAAALQVGATVVPGTAGAAGATGTPFTFAVNTNVQTAGSETPLAFSVSGTDMVGNTSSPVVANDGAGNAVVLKIDGAGPQISGVSVATATDAPSITTEKWFNQQSANPILINATIIDNGSGVNKASVAVQVVGGATLTGADAVITPPAAGGSGYLIAIPRQSTTTGLVAHGAAGQVTLQIVAKDNVGNPTAVAIPVFGIDGSAPTFTSATAVYPPADCPAGVVCGHDGNHFYRRNETVPLSLVIADLGAGVDTAAGTWQIGADGDANKTMGATTFPSSTSVAFTPDFSKVTFTSNANGAGTVEVKVTIFDLVGNSTTKDLTTVNVTRLRWAQHNGAVIPSAANPLAISGPAAQVVFAGTNTGGDPIVSYAQDGSQLWTAGHAQGLNTVASDLAYSPATNLIYAVPSNAGSVYAFHLASNGKYDSTLANCSFFVSTTGSPALTTAGGAEYALVSDNGSPGSLWAVHATPTSGTCPGPKSISPSGVTWSAMTTPTTDGSTVYFGRTSTGTAATALADALFGAAASFSGLNDPASAQTVTIADRVALAGALFFGDTTSRDYIKDSPGIPLTQAWATLGTSANPIAAPVIANGLVYGAYPNALYAFDPTSGAATLNYSASGLTTPIVASDGTLYLTNSGQVQALTSANPAGQIWSFTGTAMVYGATAINIGTPTPAVIDAQGVVYFADSTGNVFAVLTDSPGPMAKSATVWPRASGDNCNSGNSAFSCQ